MMNNYVEGTDIQKLRANKKLVRGFTFIEVLVTIGLFAVIAAFGLGVGIDTFGRSRVQSDRDLVVLLLQKARARSMNNINQSKHGLYIDTSDDEFVLFQGDSYATRVSEEVTPISPNITFSGDPEVVFEQLSGKTSDHIIEVSGDAANYDITTNNEGRINW